MNLYKLPKGETQKVIYANKKGEETFVASHKILGNYTLYSIGDNKKLTKVTTAEKKIQKNRYENIFKTKKSSKVI